MIAATGESPGTRRPARFPVIAAFIAAPIVWAALYWIFRVPAGTLLQAFALSPAATPLQSPAIDLSSTLWWLLIKAVLLYPVLEEIIFRGAIQGWLLERAALRKWLTGLISIPNILTSLVFCALHFISQPPLWAALVFIPSLVFGWSREHTGGLTIPILLHIWYNAGFYFLFVRF